MSTPHSDALFIKTYPAETTEAFCDGHSAAFAFFGGVPLSILYDNTTIAVAKICGDGKRDRTRRRLTGPAQGAHSTPSFLTLYPASQANKMSRVSGMRFNVRSILSRHLGPRAIASS